MKKYLFLLLLWCFSALSFAQDSLRLRIDSLLQDPMFETSQVGLMVYDLTADSVYYQHNARQLLRPASTMKLVTAITALDQLGPKYDFKTSIYYTGSIKNRTLEGNIYCVGGFDPTLTLEDVTDMALSIQQLGIDSIAGKLVADRTMKEPVDYGEGWCWDDENPLLTPLSIGRKNIFLTTFSEEVARLGVNLENVTLVEGQLPSNAHHLTTIRHNISLVLDRMMKKSDNFYAEAVFYQTAASVRKSLAKACRGRLLPDGCQREEVAGQGDRRDRSHPQVAETTGTPGRYLSAGRRFGTLALQLRQCRIAVHTVEVCLELTHDSRCAMVLTAHCRSGRHTGEPHAQHRCRR